MYPLVTVAIPTYNRKKYLREALDSAVSQDYPNLEIFVSDNNSDDGTEEMMQDYMREHPQVNIRYERRERNGDGTDSDVMSWRNRWNRLSGEYVLLLHDDDLLELRAISHMVKAMQDDVSCVAGNMLIIDRDGQMIGKTAFSAKKRDEFDMWYGRLMGNFYYPPPSIMWRTRLFHELFPKCLPAWFASDVSLLLLFSQVGKVQCIQIVTVRYRYHDDNMSKQFYDLASSNVDLFKMFVEQPISGLQKKWLNYFCVWEIWRIGCIAYETQHDLSLMMRIFKLLNYKSFYTPRMTLLAGQKDGYKYETFFSLVKKICNKAFTMLRKWHDLRAMVHIVNLLNWKNFHMPLPIGWGCYAVFFCWCVMKKVGKILRGKS